MKKIIFIYLLLFCNSVTAQLAEDSLLRVAETQLLQKMPDNSINISTNIINSTTNIHQKNKALVILSKAWLAKGNELKALQYKNEMLVIKDSINTLSSNSTIGILKNNIEIEKQAKAITIQKAKIAKQQFIIYGLITLFILTTIFLRLLHKRKEALLKTQQQASLLNEKIIAASAILNAEENERKRIAIDLHDGIGQMMSAIKMNLSSFISKKYTLNQPDVILLEKTLNLIDESCKEVRSISHNMTPNALVNSNLTNAIKSFLDKIDHKKIQINFYSEGLDNKLSNNTEIILYRAIQEIVNNVVKHASANKLDISLIKDNDGLSCNIEDNGKGFNLKNNFSGIGLKNIKNRITYLAGTVEWDSSPNKGTLVAIHIPS
jgi:two-component system NarL family sensor kinase